MMWGTVSTVNWTLKILLMATLTSAEQGETQHLDRATGQTYQQLFSFPLA